MRANDSYPSNIQPSHEAASARQLALPIDLRKGSAVATVAVTRRLYHRGAPPIGHVGLGTCDARRRKRALSPRQAPVRARKSGNKFWHKTLPNTMPTSIL